MKTIITILFAAFLINANAQDSLVDSQKLTEKELKFKEFNIKYNKAIQAQKAAELIKKSKPKRYPYMHIDKYVAQYGKPETISKYSSGLYKTISYTWIIGDTYINIDFVLKGRVYFKESVYVSNL